MKLAAGIVSGAIDLANATQTSSCGLELSPCTPVVPPLRTASVKASTFFLCQGLREKSGHCGERGGRAPVEKKSGLFGQRVTPVFFCDEAHDRQVVAKDAQATFGSADLCRE